MVTKHDIDKEDEEENHTTNNNNTKRKKAKVYIETPFKGIGLLKFDDFNYGAINQIVFALNRDNNELEHGKQEGKHSSHDDDEYKPKMSENLLRGKSEMEENNLDRRESQIMFPK